MMQTDQDHARIAAEIMRALGQRLGAEASELIPLSVTAWNSHFRLRLGGELKHLVLYNLPDKAATNGLVFEHRILRHLQAEGFPLVPTLLEIEGDSLFAHSDGWYALTGWVEGCRREDDPPLRPPQVRAFARGLAQLHAAMAPIEDQLDYHPDHVFVYPTHSFLEQRGRLLESLEARLGGAAFDEAARRAWAASRPRLERQLADFPVDLYERVHAARPGIVHGDYRPLNAAFEGDDLRCILDFNCCFNEIRLWDVAYTALGLGGKETVGLLSDLQAPADFIAAYHHAAPLSDEERRLLPHLLAFVPAKLMVGAIAGWWITDRHQMLGELLDGAADEIVARALQQTKTGEDQP